MADMARLTPWETRIGLARTGWQTEIRLTRSGISSTPTGNVAAGVWARRMHWAGGIADICLHEHAILAIDAPEAAGRLGDLVQRVERLCRKAERDFSQTVPCQLMERAEDGLLRLSENKFQTQHLLTQDRNLTPSEAIPPGVEAGPDAHLLALLIAARDGLEAEDSVNPHFGRSRYARDCENREWGFKLRLAVREAAGVKVSYRPQEFTTRLLSPGIVSALISGSKASLADLLRAYGPEGNLAGETSNGLPPGFETLEEMIANREAGHAVCRAELAEEPDP